MLAVFMVDLIVYRLACLIFEKGREITVVAALGRFLFQWARHVYWYLCCVKQTWGTIPVKGSNGKLV